MHINARGGQCLRRSPGSGAAAAHRQDLLAREAIDCLADTAQRDMNGVGRVPCRPFIVFADIDEDGAATPMLCNVARSNLVRLASSKHAATSCYTIHPTP